MFHQIKYIRGRTYTISNRIDKTYYMTLMILLAHRSDKVNLYFVLVMLHVRDNITYSFPYVKKGLTSGFTSPNKHYS